MNILVVTNMYPNPRSSTFGLFVHDQVAALREAGVIVDVLFVDGRASAWNYLTGLVRFWRLLRRRQYDLIHAHYVLAGLIARAQWGHRVVLTHHGCEVLGFPRWQTWLARLVTPLFDEVIYTGEHMRQALGDKDGWVVPCGIDVTLFTPMPRAEARTELGLPADAPLVLWAGNPRRREKRFGLVEEAIQHLHTMLPSARLVVADKVPHAAIPRYMSACDAFVFTSAVEGSPMVIKEAMACNLPIISVRVGDVAEIIGATPPCALAERDPNDIARKLYEVLKRPRRTQGRARVEHLRHACIAQRVLAVYARAVRASPRQLEHSVE